MTDPHAAETQRRADAPHGLTIDAGNNLYFTTQSGGLYKCTPQGVVTPIASIDYPGGLDVDAAKTAIVAWLADRGA